jgi:hypothetical protein
VELIALALVLTASTKGASRRMHVCDLQFGAPGGRKQNRDEKTVPNPWSDRIICGSVAVATIFDSIPLAACKCNAWAGNCKSDPDNGGYCKKFVIVLRQKLNKVRLIVLSQCWKRVR